MAFKHVLATLPLASAVLATSQPGCGFTLSSSGNIACPAGQLPDGQIRLNGTYDTATFYISDGKITDSEGKGCLITDPPTTQVQCDLNNPPVGGFAIDTSNTLSHSGSMEFYACPATDTEYNIYVHPNFGQTKCFPITLTASGCGAASSSSSSSTSCSSTSTYSSTLYPSTTTSSSAECSASTVTTTSTTTTVSPGPSTTVWATTTLTLMSPVQVIVTETAIACNSSTTSSSMITSCDTSTTTSSSSLSSKAGCHKCTAGSGNSTSIWSSTYAGTSMSGGYPTNSPTAASTGTTTVADTATGTENSTATGTTTAQDANTVDVGAGKVRAPRATTLKIVHA